LSDAFLFLSIAWYLASKGEHNGVFLSLGTLVGAFLISLIFALLTGWLVPILWIMFVLMHVTVIQRVYHVWKVMKVKI
jgi:phosphatidylglycerophosphate synthase